MADQQIKYTRLDLAAKMNDLANNEVLGAAEDFFCTYLQNADLFYEKSLAIRPGTEDLCGGFVWGNYNTTTDINTTTGVSMATARLGYDPIYQTNRTFNPLITTVGPKGFIYIPSSGITSINSGSFTLRGVESGTYFSTLGAQANYDISFKVMIFPLDQTPIRASGTSFMSGFQTNTANGVTNSGLHNIGLSGNYGSPPYPQIQPNGFTSAFSSLFPTGVNPIAIGETIISMGTYNTMAGGGRQTNDIPVTVNFNPAVPISGTTQAYYGRLSWSLTSGNLDRTIQVKTIQLSGFDLAPNAVMVQELSYAGDAFYSGQTYALITGFNPPNEHRDKTWPIMTLGSYNSCDFLKPDNFSANYSYLAPIVNTGVTPPIPKYTSFGQTLELLSGQILYGNYFYTNPTALDYTSTFLDAAGLPLSGLRRVGIRTELAAITASNGNINSNNYVISSYSGITITSGYFDFNFSRITNFSDLSPLSQVPPNYRLNKVYSMFDSPVTISNSGLYLIRFNYFDYETGGDYTDYQLNGGNKFNAFGVGVNNVTNFSGVYLVDLSGVDQYTQISPSQIIGPRSKLSCGLITVPSGSWINGIYDYRIGGDRSSKIVYGQGSGVRHFELSNPNKANHITIYNSGSTKQDALWTYATYDDLLFAHQYSQISGICWNQTSGVQLHGLQPVANINTNGYLYATGMAPFVSGLSYNILIAAQMDTGGYRTQEYTVIANSGQIGNRTFVSGAVFTVKNPDNNTNFGIGPQYNFDLFGGMQGRGTYIFTTATSGSIYYLAALYSGASGVVGPQTVPMTQPILNSGNYGANGLFIGRPAIPELDTSLETALAIEQNYFVSQVPTPKFKKIQVFYDYILGIGDPNFNSRLWYSEQYAPQIWQESFNFGGFVDVDKDNGSPLTSMEKLRQYMILFKKNATYRVEFLGQSTNPFAIAQISSKIGSLGAFGTITVGDTVYGLSKYGIFACNGNTVQTISDPIKPFYDSLDHADLTFAVALHDMNHSTIIWSIANNSSSPDKNLGIVFDYKEGSFSIRKGPMWNAAATVEDSDGFDVLLGGTSDGQIQVEESKTSKVDVFFNDGKGFQATKDIEFIAETPWLSIDDSQFQKEIKYLDINTNKVDTILGVKGFYDQNEDAVRFAREIDCNKNSSDKRVPLGNQAKTVKLKFYNIGNSPTLKINNITIYYIPLGHQEPS